MATALLRRLAAGKHLSGRHVVVTAHADDETISAAAAMCALEEVVLVQLTERRDERAAALEAGGWRPSQVIDLGLRNREAHLNLAAIVAAVQSVLQPGDTVWTHPYEGGHLDHDSAAWAVARACVGRPVLRMEFASYHLAGKTHVFGAFWPDARCPEIAVKLTPDWFQRKLAAVTAYGSQAHILRKFPNLSREEYRAAPDYDFSRPAPPPRSRWDAKGYLPPTSVWRAAAEAA